jgi:SAM-dependent methyltransferase
MRCVPRDTVDQPNPSLLRRCYWQWQAWCRQARGRRELSRLRAQARRAPPFQTGTIRLDGFTASYDARAALGHCRRILKPGGVLLATVPGISQISRYDMDRWGDFWRFTQASMRRMLEERFPPANVDIRLYGNVRAASAFLYGVAAEDLKNKKLDHSDDDYPVIIAARAVRAA